VLKLIDIAEDVHQKSKRFNKEFMTTILGWNFDSLFFWITNLFFGLNFNLCPFLFCNIF
jgi:hypothetical protein